ncbi:MAG: hypothetical protein E6Q97_32840 [Desulfurellales bacterium]|nr:MAG: hypothetical protein E6Q97_32840 [Desulfurellales bacterium]
MKLDTVIDVSGFPGASKTHMRDALRAGFYDAGMLWWRKYRPRHFAMTAFAEYGYTKRNSRYTKWKMRHLRHSLPLVRTGRSRDLTQSKAIIATASYVHVRMSARVFNFKPKGFKGSMSKEMTTISSAEHQAMTETVESTFAKVISRAPTRRRKQRV